MSPITCIGADYVASLFWLLLSTITFLEYWASSTCLAKVFDSRNPCKQENESFVLRTEVLARKLFCKKCNFFQGNFKEFNQLPAQNSFHKFSMWIQLKCLVVQHEVIVCTKKSDSCHNGKVFVKNLQIKQGAWQIFMINDKFEKSSTRVSRCYVGKKHLRENGRNLCKYHP